jgi:hypothetical protein
VWDEKYSGAARKLAQTLKPVVDAIASGAKMTKADAARTGLPAEELQNLQDWLANAISKSRQERKLAIFELQPVGSVSPRYKKNVKCPVCGSDQHELCVQLLDYDKVELKEFPIEDWPEFKRLHFRNGTCYPPCCCWLARSTAPQPTLIVFILAETSRNYKPEKQALVEFVTQSVEEALKNNNYSFAFRVSRSFCFQHWAYPSGATSRASTLTPVYITVGAYGCRWGLR